MPTLTAQKRKKTGSPKTLREKEQLPAVLYGPKIETEPIKVDLKEFKSIYEEAGRSSLISLKLKGEKEENLVLVHETQTDPVSGEFIHIDFYQPSLDEKVETEVPLEFVGVAPAVKKEGGTLVKDIMKLEIKAPPREIPNKIEVNIDPLETFADDILIKDLDLPEEVEVMKDPETVVASVVPPKEIEEELEEPIEERIEEIETIKEAEEKEEVEEALETEGEQAEEKEQEKEPEKE